MHGKAYYIPGKLKDGVEKFIAQIEEETEILPLLVYCEENEYGKRTEDVGELKYCCNL